MPNINDQIQQIITTRKETRLPQIEKEIEFLKHVKSKVVNLDSVINAINHQIAEKHGPYYAMLQSDPSMETRFMAVSTGQVKKLIDEQLEHLEILRKRFSRDAVQIAFIGYERQGKSCFLQSISGLSNKVIPAYSGTSCTGAVSVIHNVPKELEVHIEFYDLKSFLNILKEKLHNFFPNNHFTLNSLNDLSTIDLSEFTTDDPEVSLEFNKFKDAFFGHLNVYESLIGHSKLVTDDQNQIIQHVSQYEEFDVIPEGDDASLYTKKKKQDTNGNEVEVWQKNYYKYIAVKSVNIYTQFVDPRIGDSKIVLVDTIGMGDASNAERIEDEMFRVLREDCDAAVDVFKPQANGDSFNKQQNEVLKKIGRRLADREPYRWIFYVLNRVEGGKGYNVEVVPSIMEQIKTSFASMKTKPVADVLDINAINTEEVNQRLVSPLLDLITENLDDIDAKLIVETNKSNDNLYQEYKMLADAVAAVVSGSMIQNTNEGKLFDKLFKGLSYSKNLRDLDEYGYAKTKDEPCVQVRERIDMVINDLVELVPDAEECIYPDVESGDKDTNGIFVKHLNAFRNTIFEAFEEVNTEVLIPLQEKVKDDLINILFNEAKMGNIPLQDYSIEDGASQAWLKALVEEKVDKGVYPRLHDMLMFILNYNLNIEGLIEYNVAKCLNTIDPLSEECPPMHPLTSSLEEQAEEIWAEIVNRITPIQNKLRLWRNDFALIPSHSFYARVHKFRDKMVFGDEETKDNIRDFYRDNRLSIWRDDFADMAVQDQAFGAWNKESKAITDMCVKSKFYINLNN